MLGEEGTKDSRRRERLANNPKHEKRSKEPEDAREKLVRTREESTKRCCSFLCLPNGSIRADAFDLSV